VSGHGGVGKSSVVSEFRKVVPPQGLFAAGKFDQYKRDIPYATLARAVQGLVRGILGRDDTELTRWHHALLEVLGPNGQLMVTLIPELAASDVANVAAARDSYRAMDERRAIKTPLRP
jgi:predicted ATPase